MVQELVATVAARKHRLDVTELLELRLERIFHASKLVVHGPIPREIGESTGRGRILQVADGRAQVQQSSQQQHGIVVVDTLDVAFQVTRRHETLDVFQQHRFLAAQQLLGRWQLFAIHRFQQLIGKILAAVDVFVLRYGFLLPHVTRRKKLGIDDVFQEIRARQMEPHAAVF